MNDEPDACELLVRFLGQAGFLTDGAQSDREAMYKATQHLPRCVVLDMQAGGVGSSLKILDQMRTHEDRPTVVETVRRIRAQVRARPTVGVALAVMVAAGLAGEGVDRLWQFHLFEDEAGDDGTVAAVGLLFATGLLLGAVLATWVERRLRDDDPATPRRLVAVANVGVAVSVVLLAVAPWGIAAAGVVASMALREASYPLIQAWVNRGADPATRATLNSLVGQSESIGEIGGGPILGTVGATAGVPVALVSSAAVFGVGALLTRWRPDSVEVATRPVATVP